VAEGAAPLDALTASVAPFLDQASGETARQHLDPLAREGILNEDGDVYTLTKHGWELFQSLAGEVQTTRDLIVAGLPQGEYERTVAALAAMIRNLEAAA
jgi:DNA-binding MarR family transcriptional regulator